MLMQADEKKLPPFLERVWRSKDWPDLVAQALPDIDLPEGERLTSHGDCFDDSVVCRLYEALYCARRKTFVHKIAEEFLGHCSTLPGDAHIVEAGCGPGIVLLELADLARKSDLRWRFTGYDPSPEMIHIANQRLAAARLDNVRFVCTSAAKQEGSALLTQASAMLARNVLSWVDDVDREMALWKRYLTPGTLIVSREVRRDIPLDLLKQRILESCQFELDGQTFYYPLREYLVAFLRAFTQAEHAALLSRHFPDVKKISPRGGLDADGKNVDQAEMELRCYA